MLEELVTKLDEKALRAFHTAMVDAEAHVHPEFTCFTNNNKSIMGAFQIATYLLGNGFDISGRVNHSCLGQPFSYQGHIKRIDKINIYKWPKTTEHYKGKVWCPTTKNGTWIMRQNGRVLITGNSWKEVNFKRYLQLGKNAASNKALSAAMGRKLAGSALKSPYTAYRIGKFMVKASMFWAMVQTWNHLVFSDEEEELPDDVRSRPHIILGRDKAGKIQYFSRLGALADLLEWFGLDAAPQYVNDWFSGKRTLKEIATEMAKSPANVFIQGGEPFIKIGTEVLTRRALFPDAFNPRTVRNRGLHIFQSIGLENEYKALFNLPSRPYKKSIVKFFAYDVDPMEVAYSNIAEKKNQFMRKIGKWGEGFWITDKGNALYNARLSLRYKDDEAAVKYMGEYFMLGGTLKGLLQSLGRMDPLSGMTDVEKLAFVAQMTQTETQDLIKAYSFYFDLLTSNVDNVENKKPETLTRPPGLATLGDVVKQKQKEAKKSTLTKRQLKNLIGR